jgi:hypothetical protein
VHTATTASGNQAVLDVRWCQYGYFAGETGCYSLYTAEFELNGTTVLADEFFRLVYAATHHNWEEKYLVILDVPAGDTHAVLVEAPNAMPPVDAKMNYLDADLHTLSTEEIADWQTDR